LRHSVDHFGDDLHSQSLDWCKNPLFPTNHSAGTSKQNQTAAKNLNNSYK